MYDTNNIFAKIIRGEIPCNKIAENEHALSFYDINPLCTTHVLVIPRGAYENILDFVRHASPAEQAAFWACVSETATRLGVTANFNILTNAGSDAPLVSQSVMHFHIHLVAGECNANCREVFKCPNA